MKIVLIFFILLSPFFAKEIKQNSKAKESTAFKIKKDSPLTINILEIKLNYNEHKYNLNSRYAPI
ncbi:hypothetical protein [Arcobacter vandammei]|uniref:hypothetical protein n=1 Tax=Arcobacter vandammei TaxID=2782243 RepID=UPI0018DF7805|nr:hypothetical protein [Arcobacter vandammei]